MAALTQYVFHFGQPWWLLTALAAVPMIALAWRNLAPLGRARQVMAVVFRALMVLLLAAILARPMMTDKNDQLTLIAVIDRSLSIPQEVQQDLLLGRPGEPEYRPYLSAALAHKPRNDRLAVVDVAERAYISQLPSGFTEINKRSTDLLGNESRLSAGIEIGLAIAPPDTSVRMLLVSDGNETAGDLKEAARIAAANGIPIDVLSLKYRYNQEVVFKSIVAPVKARSGQTIPLRMVLNYSGKDGTTAKGKLLLYMNGRAVPLGGSSDSVGLPVELKPGVNVQMVSVPLGLRGMHEFRADFIPADPSQDSLEPNNHASAITFVSGPGHVLVIDEDGKAGEAIVKALRAGKSSADGSPFDVRHVTPSDFPANVAELVDCDAIVLANVGCDKLSLAQQEMLVRYVGEMGGGLVMSGGPHSFGAGGWIGSPVANIMPVDMDPPQKKQMPKGALVLLMHACEVSQGNYWSKQVAKAAVDALSRLDLAGVLEYGTTTAGNHWIYPLKEVGDKEEIKSALKNMQMGDMPDFQTPMQDAYDELKKVKAGQKHVIIISDGDPAPPTGKLLAAYRDSGISVTTVGIGTHSTPLTMQMIAQETGGTFYEVTDPKKLPQIFVKEAQIVRRSLIVEDTVKLKITNSVNEIVRGLTACPTLDGYILTGPKAGGLNQLVLASESDGDPILAAGQHGLGRTVAFTSSADGRWAPSWLAWGGFNRFWEQVIRYVGKSSQSGDLEVFPDVQGRDVTLTVESVDAEGKFVQFSQLAGYVIAPDMKRTDLSLTQVGPGRYRANFVADGGGCYLVTLQYKASGGKEVSLTHSAVVVPYAPEYRSLTDNAAALAEVAHTTGGRVLKEDPEKAELFSRQGVRIPQTAMPLTGALMMVWLGVFLLDVAVRRIAVDFAAWWRTMRSVVPRLRGRRKTRDATIDRLKNKRQEYLEELSKKKSAADQQQAQVASRRYEASAGASGEMDTSAMRQGPPPLPTPASESQKKEAPKTVDRGNLDRLLDAKRRSKDKLR